MQIDEDSPLRQLVTFVLGPARYGVSIESVIEMVLPRKMEPVAEGPDYMCGLMRLRERVIPVLDLRRRLSLSTLRAEQKQLTAMLADRKVDHIGWLEALERSVRDGERFDLATDPHECAFGRWYDHYHADDPILAHHLTKFAEPHTRIHAIAERCLDLIRRENRDEALKIITETRESDLSEMVDLFDSAGALIAESSRQMVIVLQAASVELGVLVDSVESIVSYEQSQVEPAPLRQLGGASIAALIKQDDGSVIQVIEVELLIPGDVKAWLPAAHIPEACGSAPCCALGGEEG